VSDVDTVRAEKDSQIQILNERVGQLTGQNHELAARVAMLESANSNLEVQNEVLLEQVSELAGSINPKALRPIIERSYLTDWRKTENELIAAGLRHIISELRINQQSGRLRY
jgi:hypothetical protein